MTGPTWISDGSPIDDPFGYGERAVKFLRQASTVLRGAESRLLAGSLDVAYLTVEEGVVFNSEVAAAVDESLARTHFGRLLAAGGATTVALDDDGRIVEYRPDGTSAGTLTEPAAMGEG